MPIYFASGSGGRNAIVDKANGFCELKPHNAIRLVAGATQLPAPLAAGARSRPAKSMVHFYAYATLLLEAEVRNAIVDGTVGGYLPPHDIAETRSAKPQGS